MKTYRIVCHVRFTKKKKSHISIKWRIRLYYTNPATSDWTKCLTWSVFYPVIDLMND